MIGSRCRFCRRGLNCRFRRRGLRCGRSGTEWVTGSRYPVIRTIIITSFPLSQFIVQHFLQSAQSIAVVVADCNRFLIGFRVSIAIWPFATGSIQCATSHTNIVLVARREECCLIGVIRSAHKQILIRPRIPITARTWITSRGNIMVRSSREHTASAPRFGPITGPRQSTRFRR